MRPAHLRSRVPALAAVLLGLLGLGGCASDAVEARRPAADASAVPTRAALQWRQLPDPPLSVRLASIAVAVGPRLLVVGGDAGPPCPPTAGCAQDGSDWLRDGAAYELATEQWTAVADAPVGLLDQYPFVVVGDKLWVLTEGALLAYDVETDTWIEHPAPSLEHADVQLVSLGDRPAAISGSSSQTTPPDEAYDPVTREWAPLPADPLGPGFDRTYTATPTGPVLTARERGTDPGAAEPALVLAAQLSLDLTSWMRLPDSDLIGGYRWAWTGERMVDPTLGEADGGQVGSWGRSVPYGGTFDPASGSWGRLPGAPKGYSRTGWKVEALGGPVSAVGGWLYDDRNGSWSKLIKPDGAPTYPGAAIWVGDALFVVGGQFEYGPGEPALSGSAWVLTVRAGA